MVSSIKMLIVMYARVSNIAYRYVFHLC